MGKQAAMLDVGRLGTYRGLYKNNSLFSNPVSVSSQQILLAFLQIRAEHCQFKETL